MINICLFCTAGMSTNLIVSRMKEAALDKGIEASIEAFPEHELKEHIDKMDVALLGPQVGYKIKNAKSICEPKGIPAEIIPSGDYEMLNGDKILEFALKLTK